MPDKYHRLVTFLVDICPRPLRELLNNTAEADSSTGVPYTTLDAYLLTRKSDVDRLLQTCKIRIDQEALIYPTTGSADINTWDVSLLAVLLTNLFRGQLRQYEINCINTIREKRNELQHMASCKSVNDQYFDQSWSVLEHSVKTLAKSTGGGSLNSISKDINEALNGNMPNLGDVLRKWYLELNGKLRQQVTSLEGKVDQLEKKVDQSQGMVSALQDSSDLLQEKVDQLQNQNDQLNHNVSQLKNTINQQNGELEKLKSESQTTNTILNKAAVKRKRRSGIAEKRIKVIDHQVERMKETLARSMRKLQQDDDMSHKDDVELITKQLRDNHRVVITGYNNDTTYKCAVAAAASMDYDPDQCLEINNPADWRRVGSDDARLVVFKEPFGRQTYDAQKVSVMFDEFDNMLDIASDEEEGTIDIIIVANQNLLNETMKEYNHDMLMPACTVYVDTENNGPGYNRMSTTSDNGNSQSLLQPSATGISRSEHVWSVASQQIHDITATTEMTYGYRNSVDCCQLPSGEFLVVIETIGLLKLNVNYQVIGTYVNALLEAVCYIGNSEAVVRSASKLHFVDVEGMSPTKSMDIAYSSGCLKMACHDDQLYVIDRKTVFVYNTDGIKQRVLYKCTTNNTYIKLSDIAVSDDGRQIYLTYQNKIVTLDSSGNHLYTLTDPALSGASGVCVDGEGHVLVCSRKCILQLSSDAKYKIGTIIKQSSLFGAICFDRRKSIITCLHVVSGYAKATAFKLI